jgi:hypothetical protein
MFVKKSYRSAQRNIRIAKYIDKYPEMHEMSHRHAEIYLSEKIKSDRVEPRKRPHKRIDFLYSK